MNVRGISKVLESGVELVGNLVKENAKIKVERAKYDMEAQKRRDELGMKAASKGVETASEVLKTVATTIAENQTKKTEMSLEQTRIEGEIKKAEADEELLEKRKKFDKEMEELEKDRDLQRRKDVLQAIQSYQIEVTNAVNQSMLILGSMPVELRQRAENMLLEEIEKYRELQNKWQNDAIERAERIEKSFANNKKMKDKLQDVIYDDMKRMVQLAEDTVKRMDEDVKRINENALNFSIEGKKMVEKSFASMQLNGKEQYYIESEERSNE